MSRFIRVCLNGKGRAPELVNDIASQQTLISTGFYPLVQYQTARLSL